MSLAKPKAEHNVTTTIRKCLCKTSNSFKLALIIHEVLLPERQILQHQLWINLSYQMIFRSQFNKNFEKSYFFRSLLILGTMKVLMKYKTTHNYYDLRRKFDDNAESKLKLEFRWNFPLQRILSHLKIGSTTEIFSILIEHLLDNFQAADYNASSCAHS